MRGLTLVSRAARFSQRCLPGVASPARDSPRIILFSFFQFFFLLPSSSRIFEQKRETAHSLHRQGFKFRTIHQLGKTYRTSKCARARCKSCPFIRNAEKTSGPIIKVKRSVKITDRFTCTSAKVIYCLTCTFCKKSYIGETGRRLGDRFREHLRDVEKDDKDASKPIARHLNLPNHTKQHMSVCRLSLHPDYINLTRKVTKT